MHDIRLYDLVLTTYDTLRSDEVNGGPLFEQEWARVILDEGSISSKAPVLYMSFSSFTNTDCLHGASSQN